jgi:phenylacetate-coenzyme A ligase PaaK-like adenylate-forming protein
MNTNRLKTHWQKLSSREIGRMQAEKLRRYLQRVILPFSPHYGQMLAERNLDLASIRELKDLNRLPFTSKADLLPAPGQPERFKDFILSPSPKTLARRFDVAWRAAVRGKKEVMRELSNEFRPVSIFFTTGRSSDPLPFLLTNHDLANIQSASRRLMEICGARPEFRMLNAFPFAPHLAFWFTYYAGVSYGVLSVSSGGGKVMGTEGNLRLIRQLKPEVIIGVPTFIYHLLHQAAEAGVRCETLRRLVLGGEKASDGMRRKLCELAGELGARDVSVLATYGFTEAKLAWAECMPPPGGPPSGYHLYPDLGIIEVIDPKTGLAVEPGRPGEIVFTPLEARGSVVLRYRTGDYIDGGLTYEPCPYCNRSLPRLVGNISRASEIKELSLAKLKGTLVDFNQIERVLDDAPHVGMWQLELRKAHDDPLELDELILHVQKNGDAGERQVTCDLNERFYSRTEVHPNRIVFHDAEEMRRLQGVGVQLKEQKIVDHRPRAVEDPVNHSSSGASEAAAVAQECTTK